MGVTIVEMGVEEKMAPEDQHGGYSHPTSHSTSSDLGVSLHIMDRQHGDFDVCCSPGTSATQHSSLIDLAFSASIWLFGCCS